jgi:hypothetical protein
MSIIINKKTTLFLMFLTCCTININSVAADDKLPYVNLEIENLNHNLDNLKNKKERILKDIERLKEEKLLSYHINKNFNAVYRKPYLVSGANIYVDRMIQMLWNINEVSRIICAYGFLPISLPLTIAYGVKEWNSNKNNDNETRITKLEKTLPQIESDIKKIQQKIAETETEAKKINELENFITTYPSTYIRPAKISNYSTQSTSP